MNKRLKRKRKGKNIFVHGGEETAEVAVVRLPGSSSLRGRSNQASVAPNVGYFVTKGLAVGAVTQYSTGRSLTDSPLLLPDGNQYSYRSRSHSFMLGPSIHYYLMLGEKLALFGQTSLAWGRYVSTNTFPETSSVGTVTIADRTYRNRSRAFSIGPGLAYFLNPHVALLGGVSYRNDHTKQEESETSAGGTYNTNGVYLNVGVQVFLGQ